MLRKQQVAATAAVGAAALLMLREDAEIISATLAFAEESDAEEEARDELFAAKALCDSIDAMLAAMPQPAAKE